MYKIGDVVYVYYEVSSMTRVIKKAEVIDVDYEKQIARISFNRSGSENCTVPVARLYPSFTEIFSAKEAQVAIQQKQNDQVAKYKNQIKTVDDLINFPLTHCFMGEEYTDDEVVRAYKERANELGFEIYQKQEVEYERD